MRGLQLVKKTYFVIALIFGILIVVKSKDYLFPNFNYGFLVGKKNIFFFYKFFLYAHIIGAPIALFTGLIQFVFKKSKLHPAFGKAYILSVLILAAPSGLIMSFFAKGGFLGILNFSTLSILWWIFSYKAYTFIKNGNIKRHKEMMIRSFILANSAVGLRLLGYINHEFQLFDINYSYLIISWLSWLPAYLSYEIILIKKNYFK